MKKVYFWSMKIPKRDLLLVMFAFIILIAGVICRVDAYETTLSSTTAQAVANKTIVIDPGHGGIDPGAVGSQGTLEKDVNLKMAHSLKTMLSNAGAIVIMTRETDTDLTSGKNLSPNSRKRMDLKKRVAIANKSNADIYISLHLNSFPASRWTGAQTFYQNGQPGGKALAECIQEELIGMLKNTERQPLGDDFYTTRQTKMPAVVIEMGFLSNPREEILLKSEKYQQKMAQAIYAGVVSYFSQLEGGNNTQ